MQVCKYKYRRKKIKKGTTICHYYFMNKALIKK